MQQHMQFYATAHVCLHGLVVHQLHLVDLVARAESIEEMLHRHTTLHGDEVGDLDKRASCIRDMDTSHGKNIHQPERLHTFSTSAATSANMCPTCAKIS